VDDLSIAAAWALKHARALGHRKFNFNVFGVEETPTDQAPAEAAR